MSLNAIVGIIFEVIESSPIDNKSFCDIHYTFKMTFSGVCTGKKLIMKQLKQNQFIAECAK